MSRTASSSHNGPTGSSGLPGLAEGEQDFGIERVRGGVACNFRKFNEAPEAACGNNAREQHGKLDLFPETQRSTVPPEWLSARRQPAQA